MGQPINRLVRPNYFLLMLFLAAAQCGIFLVERSNKGEATPHIPKAAAVPLVFADWKGKDFSLDRESLEMLRPEAYLVRDYQDSAGNMVNLTIIYGHNKSNIHSPAFCFLGGGWNIIAKGKILIDKQGKFSRGGLEMNRLLLQKGEQKTLVLYSFLSPGSNTASWATFQAKFLLARLSGKRPSGALLRLVLPIQKNAKEAEAIAERFLQSCYPAIHHTFAI